MQSQLRQGITHYTWHVRLAHGLIRGVGVLMAMAITQTAISSETGSAGLDVVRTPPARAAILRNPEQVDRWLAQGVLTAEGVPDPHGDPAACVACHAKEPAGPDLNLRTTDIDRLCNNCHRAVSRHDYIHPSNVGVGAGMRKRMPKPFRDAIRKTGNRLSCISCHDLPKLCKKDVPQYGSPHTMFLRGGPYRSRSDICFRCHDRDGYQRLNPHEQLTAEGELRRGRCRICHKTTANLEDATALEDVDFNYRENLSQMCLGCHPWKPHPGGTFAFGINNHQEINHLVVPPADMQRFISSRAEARENILPLEPGTGKIFCGTCHNPHQEGVIANELAARGADSENRLRDENLCEQCHDK